jgi:hypothetical protein
MNADARQLLVSFCSLRGGCSTVLNLTAWGGSELSCEYIDQFALSARFLLGTSDTIDALDNQQPVVAIL